MVLICLFFMFQRKVEKLPVGPGDSSNKRCFESLQSPPRLELCPQLACWRGLFGLVWYFLKMKSIADVVEPESLSKSCVLGISCKSESLLTLGVSLSDMGCWAGAGKQLTGCGAASLLFPILSLLPSRFPFSAWPWRPQLANRADLGCPKRDRVKRSVLSFKRLDSSRPGKKRGYGVSGKRAPAHRVSSVVPYIILDAIHEPPESTLTRTQECPQSSLHIPLGHTILYSWFWKPQWNGQKNTALSRPCKPSSKEKEYSVRDDTRIHNDLGIAGYYN